MTKPISSYSTKVQTRLQEMLPDVERALRYIPEGYGWDAPTIIEFLGLPEDQKFRKIFEADLQRLAKAGLIRKFEPVDDDDAPHGFYAYSTKWED